MSAAISVRSRNPADAAITLSACSQYGRTLTLVQRDLDVSVPGESRYVRTTC